MAPIRGQFLQWQQHKQPLRHAWMWQYRPPPFAIWLHLAGIINQVKIERPGIPTALPAPAKSRLDIMKLAQQFIRTKIGL